MKIHWTIKVMAFAASVAALSCFFAGWRQVHESSNFANWAVLLGGTAATLLLLTLQGYWIYFAEKEKGTLRKRIVLFEKIHGLLQPHVGNHSCCGGETKKA